MERINRSKIPALISSKRNVSLRQYSDNSTSLKTPETLQRHKLRDMIIADNVNLAKAEQDKILESAARHDFYGGWINKIS